MANLYHGDCLEVLRTLEPNSIDALVTDPPAGISFMNQKWDHHKGGRDAWIEWLTQVMSACLDVMKPGAHGLIWAIPRTSHWTGMALEGAGFEIRDRVSHIFGSGFPKNHNVPMAIDKIMGAETAIVGYKKAGMGSGDSFGMLQSHGDNHLDAGIAPIREATSAEARQWEGWGTALKPSIEDWWLVRKPINGGVGKNILTHGTGALNIDGSRIATGEELGRDNSGCKSMGIFNASPGVDSRRIKEPNYKNNVYGVGFGGCEWDNTQGRWPANLVLSHAVECRSYCVPHCPIGMIGDEARFFYCAKPGMEEKEEGLDGPLLHPSEVMTGRKIGSAGAMASGLCGVTETMRRNIHPTVKASALMSYLIKLISPPGSMVIDPFMGSGSTGVAAIDLGFNFTGIEKEESYYNIAKQRIENKENNKQLKLEV